LSATAITALTDREKLERRRGEKEAGKQYTPAVSHFPGADWPLAVVQIDRTELDIMLVDAYTAAPSAGHG
jgi:putative transposase